MKFRQCYHLLALRCRYFRCSSSVIIKDYFVIQNYIDKRLAIDPYLILFITSIDLMNSYIEGFQMSAARLNVCQNISNLSSLYWLAFHDVHIRLLIQALHAPFLRSTVNGGVVWWTVQMVVEAVAASTSLEVLSAQSSSGSRPTVCHSKRRRQRIN